MMGPLQVDQAALFYGFSTTCSGRSLAEGDSFRRRANELNEIIEAFGQ
jgi:hypothetical protein